MKATTTRRTKHAVCFTSDTPASFPSVFPPDRTVVTIHTASLTIISASSVMVDDCETSTSFWSAINSVNESIFFATQTIIRATSAIMVVLQRTIALPHMIIDRIPAIIFASQMTVSEVQITISVTETVICGEHQNPANQRVPDGCQEIIISVPETIIVGNENDYFHIANHDFQDEGDHVQAHLGY